MSKMTAEEFERSPLKHAYEVMRGNEIDYREAWKILKTQMSRPPFEPVLAVIEQIESMLRPMTQAEAQKEYDEAPDMPLSEEEKRKIIDWVVGTCHDIIGIKKEAS